MKIIKLCALLVLSFVFAGCNSSPPALQDVPETTSRGYSLGAGDTVSIVVYGEPEMTMHFIIDKSGAINFPYIGPLVLKGKTPEQVSDELTARLRGEYLSKPMVTVSIVAFRKFYISGEVKNPNGYAYEPGLTVGRAIALAGGFTDRADRSDISIQRAGEGELPGSVGSGYAVHPGDIVTIGMGFF